MHYYFLYSSGKKVEEFEGGLFIYPVTEASDWQFSKNGVWRDPSYDYNVKCHCCGSRFNIVHKSGVECGRDYQKYFCDESCRIGWNRKSNKSRDDGHLHVWGKTLYDERYCVWLWGV